MTLAAIFLAGITILLVGMVVGYLWGREDGHRTGYQAAYDEVDRYYARQRKASR